MPESKPSILNSMRYTAISALVGGAALFIPAIAEADTPAYPGNINVAYELKLAGLRFAKIQLLSEINGENYNVRLNARNSSVGRLIKFGGTTTSSGEMSGDRPLADTYTLNYQIRGRGRNISVNFDGVDVESVDVQPPANTHGREPVLPEHQVDVFDPIGAFMLPMSNPNAGGEEACTRTRPVFDGRHRYELKMGYIRSFTQPSTERPGETVPIHVCSLKYQPIAGHRIKDEDMFDWANHDGVEFWVMPVYSAGVFLPVHGIFPTPFGNAVFQVTSLNISGFTPPYGPAKPQ